MNSPTPTPPSGPKKGLSGIAIAGIGCGALLLIGLIGGGILVTTYVSKGVSKLTKMADEFQKNPEKAAAMLVLKANPDIEVLRTDDVAGEVTFRDKQSGEEITMSFNELAQGKLRMKNAKGQEVTLDGSGVVKDGTLVVKGPDGQMVIGAGQKAKSAPAWVPTYPGMAIAAGGMSFEKGDQVTGASVGESADSVARVVDYFEGRLKQEGYQTETSKATINNIESATITGSNEARKRKITIVATTQDNGKTHVVISYEGPKS